MHRRLLALSAALLLALGIAACEQPAEDEGAPEEDPLEEPEGGDALEEDAPEEDAGGEEDPAAEEEDDM